jgi:hypothetical protein
MFIPRPIILQRASMPKGFCPECVFEARIRKKALEKFFQNPSVPLSNTVFLWAIP